MNSYFQPRKMYHTPPPLSCNGKFNVLLFFLGEKDDFTMTKAVRGGGGGLKESFYFFYKFFPNIWKSEAIFFL